MGDIVIPVFVFGLIFGTLALIAFIALSKNNAGAWDEASRLKGQMRAKGWRVRDTVRVIEDFLFCTRHELDHWPIPRSVPGVQAVSADKGMPWHAVTLTRSSGATLVVSIELPQLSDGTEAEMSEALVIRSGESYEVQTTATDFPFFVTDEVRAFIENWSEPFAFHFIGDSVSAFFNVDYPDPQIVETLERHTQRLALIKGLLPREVWA